MLLDAGFELRCNDTGKRPTAEDLKQMLSGAYAVVAGTEKYTADVLSAADDLKAVIRFGVGTDNFDIPAMREKGLAIGVLSAKGHITDQRTGKIGVTTTSAIRIVLDRCATVKEATEMLAQFDMHQSRGSNYHFQLVDATGDSAVVEYANGNMYVLPDRYVTNFFLTPGVSTSDCGLERYKILERIMAETDGIFSDMNAALDPLKQVSEDGTRWSSVYNSTDRSVLMVLEHNFERTYTFRLDDPSL